MIRQSLILTEVLMDYDFTDQNSFYKCKTVAGFQDIDLCVSMHLSSSFWSVKSVTDSTKKQLIWLTLVATTKMHQHKNTANVEQLFMTSSQRHQSGTKHHKGERYVNKLFCHNFNFNIYSWTRYSFPINWSWKCFEVIVALSLMCLSVMLLLLGRGYSELEPTTPWLFNHALNSAAILLTTENC